MKNYFIFGAVLLTLGIFAACSNSSGSLTTSSAFSSAGVISSPFTTASSSIVDRNVQVLPSKYTDLKAKIDDMLAVSTGSTADCKALLTIDFSKYSAANAHCYGPEIRV